MGRHNMNVWLLHILSQQPEVQGSLVFGSFVLFGTYIWWTGWMGWAGLAGVLASGIVLTKKITAGGSAGQLPSQKGKTIIITGGYVGIGKATAVEMAKAGGRVVIACRSLQRATPALKQIKQEANSDNVELRQLDLSSFQSIREFVKSWGDDPIDILVNNAGVMMCPYSKTEDGFETQFGTNHLGHFLLTKLLLPRLIDAGDSRILNVSSFAHTFPSKKVDWESVGDEKAYNPTAAYGFSKLANVYFTYELQRQLQLQGTTVTAFSLHPGAVRTRLTRHFASVAQILAQPMMWLLFKSPLQGAQTSLYLATAPLSALKPGAYYHDCKVGLTSPISKLPDEPKLLWDLSE